MEMSKIEISRDYIDDSDAVHLKISSPMAVGLSDRSEITVNLSGCELTSPTGLWVMGVYNDPYIGLKVFKCVPIVNTTFPFTGNWHGSIINQVLSQQLNMQGLSLVKTEDLLHTVPYVFQYENGVMVGTRLTIPSYKDVHLTTAFLMQAGVDVNQALPPMYTRLGVPFDRKLPTIRRQTFFGDNPHTCIYTYSNVEFTEHIDLLGSLGIIGYDFGVSIQYLPRQYVIEPNGLAAIRRRDTSSEYDTVRLANKGSEFEFKHYALSKSRGSE